MTQDQNIDVSDMVAVHGVFRDTLAQAPVVIGELQPGDDQRIELVGNFYENILAFLHVHHHGEDTLVFPLLRERCGAERETIERVASQHNDVNGLMANAERSLGEWATGDETKRTETASLLGLLHVALRGHLDDEERDVLPLCANHLTIEEWRNLPAHGMANFAGDKPWLVLGLVRERLTQEQRDEMLAHMPPPAVAMWANVGEAAFTGLMADLTLR